MDHPDYLGMERTVFSLKDDNIDYVKHYLGLLIFIVLFVIGIPYLLIAAGSWGILSAYFPNLDMIATILGYHAGPADSFIWTHLYNPSDTSITGYITSNLINLFALLGVVFVIIHYALSTKSMFSALARAAIMLPMTYFIPGNLIVYLMYKFGKYLNRFYMSKSIQHYLLVVALGFVISLLFIMFEAVLIKQLVPIVSKITSEIAKVIM